MDEARGAALPPEFEAKMKRLLGKEWNSFLNSYRGTPIRALRLHPDKRGEALEEEPGIGALVPWAQDARYFNGSELFQPGKHPYHEMGLYYIQEASAMVPAALLEAQPGERVLDLCAAPGGKSTQLAAAMHGRGLLIANEIHPARAKILSSNIERMGIGNAIVLNEDSGRLAERFGGFFDRILVDAPCSGEGMFRKNPEAAAEWSAEQVCRCAQRQREILKNADRMLVPGGRLVYSTCTFSPEENEQVIADFLTGHPEYELLEPAHTLPAREQLAPGRPEWADGNRELAKTVRLWPHRVSGEGHFAAVLHKRTIAELADAGCAPREEKDKIHGETPGVEDDRRQAEKPQKKKGPRSDKGKGSAGQSLGAPEPAQLACLREWLYGNLTGEAAQRLLAGELRSFGDRLWRLPAECRGALPSLDGLRVLRAGMELGTLRKGRMEPAHALALCLDRADALRCVKLVLPAQRERAAAWFRGESIPAEGTDSGWCLVCVDGFPAGWGKQSGAVVKNHYPKGLRKALD